MDASGTWTPVGVALAMTEPNGPVEHAFFVELLGTIGSRTKARCGFRPASISRIAAAASAPRSRMSRCGFVR